MNQIKTSRHHLTTIIVGIMGTLVIDCWTLLLNCFSIGSRGLLFLGRWLMYLPQGKISHYTIIQSPSLANEMLVGRIAHYIIGIVFAFLLISIYGQKWLVKPRLMPAIYIALVSLLIPLFVVQPLLGFGLAFSNLPNSAALILKTLSIHLVYGFGLFLAAKLLTFLRQHFVIN